MLVPLENKDSLFKLLSTTSNDHISIILTLDNCAMCEKFKKILSSGKEIENQDIYTIRLQHQEITGFKAICQGIEPNIYPTVILFAKDKSYMWKWISHIGIVSIPSLLRSFKNALHNQKDMNISYTGQELYNRIANRNDNDEIADHLTINTLLEFDNVVNKV